MLPEYHIYEFAIQLRRHLLQDEVTNVSLLPAISGDAKIGKKKRNGFTIL
jgi:hypothetical protein